MNGSTEERSDTPTPLFADSNKNSKTDRPLPLVPPVEDGAVSPPNSGHGGDRIISGIDLLDYGAGGLMSHKVYVVQGGRGTGKTLLGLQYLTRGLELQEPGVLITDQKPENVIAQAHSIGFAIEESVKRGQLAILNPSSRYFDLVESPADVMAIVEDLGDYIRRMDARRLVIDPVYTLINTSYSSHFAVSITQSLINALEDLPVTTILIAGDQNDPELNPIVRQLQQNAFGVIDLSQDATSGGRVMKLGKLCYAGSEGMCANYRILDGRGLMNYRPEAGEKVADVTKPWEESTAANRSILLLGATPETIRKVTETLGNQYAVQAESDLNAGVERAKKEHPGLVLVTPSRSLGAISAILDLARNASSSVAFLSPSAHRQADKVLYLRAGADDFITEPFTPGELRARVDALIRRSGRRLNLRDSTVANVTPEDVARLMGRNDAAPKPKGPVITAEGDEVTFAPEFNERLERNVETVKKFDQPFAVYWIKGGDNDKELNRSLAQLCRQEDIVCHNRNGEFVAILPGADKSGVKGFESRLDAKLGDRLGASVRRGYTVYGEA